MNDNKKFLATGILLCILGFIFAGINTIFSIVIFVIAAIFIIVFFVKNKNDSPSYSERSYDSYDVQRTAKPNSDRRISYSEAKRNAEFMAPQWLKICKDCTNLVNTTKTPAVFFERYDLLKETCKKLSELEPYVPFSGQLPSEILKDISRKRAATINDFIDRYYNSVIEKISSLKTDKSKQGRAEAFSEALKPYYKEMLPENIERYERYISKINSLVGSSDKAELAPKQNSSLETTVKNDGHTAIRPILESRWEIGISFGKSTSSNFERALFLAKEANRFEESEYNGSAIFQAFFSSNPEDFLKFTRLYDLVGKWKSAAVTINGELIDRKIIGQLNYCYGDKCRNGREDFCYGASFMTKNPFGCHRLQISASNNPWWSFSKYNGREYIIDKNAIRDRAEQFSTAYRVCPDFSYERVMLAIDNLPDRISEQELDRLCSGQNLYLD